MINRAFTSLCYTADGSCILAGGQSKNVCIYNVHEALLLKKFEITQNRSFDAVDVSMSFEVCTPVNLLYWCPFVFVNKFIQSCNWSLSWHNYIFRHRVHGLTSHGYHKVSVISKLKAHKSVMPSLISDCSFLVLLLARS